MNFQKGEESLLNPWLDQVSLKHTITKFIVISMVMMTIVWTQPGDFAFSPSLYSSQFQQFSQVVYLIGWLLLILGSQVLAIRAAWGFDPTWLQVLVIGSMRPISEILIQANVYTNLGSFSLGYLIDRPVFLLSDIVIPGFLIYLALRERNNQKLVPSSA